MFRWYAVNTYSGHENNIRSIVIPTEQVQELKDGQKIQKETRTMPGYLLVNMNLTDDSWQLVKNTPGVTGFVGASNKPVPLNQVEVDRLLHRRVRQGRLGSAVRLLRGDLRDQ